MTSELTAIDLFCGAGGLSEGLRQAGFHVLAGNDFDEAAGATYARTHKEARFLKGPIQSHNIALMAFLNQVLRETLSNLLHPAEIRPVHTRNLEYFQGALQHDLGISGSHQESNACLQTVLTAVTILER